MKLCNQIQKSLSAIFSETFVHDQRGDGHFVQVICIDDKFAGQCEVTRSRTLYKAVEPWQTKVHAWSVKGFTKLEWAEKKDAFAYQQYQHYPKF